MSTPVGDLARKYRPRALKDLLGQEAACAWLGEQIATRSGRSVLISGHIGCGKTSAALAYARGLVCTDAGARPCEQCEHCSKFGELGRAVSDFQMISCGEQSKVEEIKSFLEIARVAPHVADRRVLVLDEVHNLSRRAFDALLQILETPPKHCTFVLLTSAIERIPRSIVGRLRHLQFGPIADATSADLLKRVCDAEGIAFEQDGLSLLASAVGGYPRQLLRELEKVGGDFGIVSSKHVRQALNLDFTDRLIEFTLALLGNDLQEQVNLLEGWGELAQRKLEFLHRFFVFVYCVSVRRLFRADAVMQYVSAADRERLQSLMSDRALLLDVAEDDLWEGIIKVVDPSDRLNDSQLFMRANELTRLLNRTPVTSGPRVIEERHKRLKLRVSSDGVSRGPRKHLSWHEIRRTWDAASFLPQHYGDLFNLRVSIRHPDGEAADHEVAATTISRVTHELGMRIKEWTGKRSPAYHWVYQHEVGLTEDITTRWVVSVPQTHLVASEAWLRSKLASSSSRAILSERAECSIRRLMRPSDAVRFHWSSVRALSRCLDPLLLAHAHYGERLPLVDLLGIPMRWRSSTADVQCSRTWGASKTLRRSVQRNVHADMPLLSCLQDRAWPTLDTGWELHESADRKEEIRRRADAEAELRAFFSSSDALARTRLQQELSSLRAGYPADAKLRIRKWQGWWLD